MTPLRIFIGDDARMPVLWHVLAHSIASRTSCPVSFTPLSLRGLKPVFDRPREALQSTDFSFSRFLVPYLAGYEGWALFMDNDMLVRDDIAALFSLRDERYAVQVAKHTYTPKTQKKFLGHTQTDYAKKNWSSVMLMNCAKCTALTPEYVSTASGLALHGFSWLEDDHLIGELPLRWNFLVGEYAPLPESDISNLHFTLGGPYFEEFAQCDYADLWHSEHAAMQQAGHAS